MSEDQEVRREKIEELAEAMKDGLGSSAPIQLSKEGENSYILNQALYRKLDHERWQEREERRAEDYHQHILKTNRFNLINSVALILSLAIIVTVLVEKVL